MGAFYGGVIIGPGRKNAFIRFNILSIIACLIQQIVSVPTLVIGKFLHGFTITVVHISSSKMLNETVPVYMLGQYGAAVQVATNIGYMLVFGFGLLLPSGDYNPALTNDENNL